MNLAGVERVLELEEVMDAMQAELDRMRAQAEQLEREMLAADRAGAPLLQARARPLGAARRRCQRSQDFKPPRTHPVERRTRGDPDAT